MEETSKQKQTTGANSTAIQARTVIIQEASPEKIAEIAREVIKRDFETLKEEALAIANSRAEELTSSFIERVTKTGGLKAERIVDPRFQFSLRDAQFEFAKSGSEELKEELANLLVEIGKAERDEIARLYEEAIKTLPLLSRAQVKAIALVLACRYLNSKKGKVDDLITMFQKEIFPFLEGAARSQYAFNHIEYAKCGQVSIGSSNLPEKLKKDYQGLFAKGVPDEDVDQEITPNTKKNLLIPSLHNPELKQIGVLTERLLTERIQELAIIEPEAGKLKKLFDRQTMSTEDIRAYLEGRDPQFVELFKYFEKTPASRLTLTSVGMIIGVMSIENITGEKIGLDDWLSDAQISE